MDYKVFFGRRVEEVAKDLVGRLLVKRTKKGVNAGQIIEVGAYEGGKEDSSREGMKYSPGKIFLMPHRGSLLLNISSDKSGFPSCVEIRKLGLENQAIVGSGKISNYLGLSESLDGVLLGDELVISGEGISKSKLIELKKKNWPVIVLGYILLGGVN